MCGCVRSAFRRRSLAVAASAGMGGAVRCEVPGLRIGVRKSGCGAGRPWVVRAWVSWGMEGVVILIERG